MSGAGAVGSVGRGIAHLATRVLLWLLRGFVLLPYPVVRATGELAGSAAYRLAAPRRRVARVNLQLCMPELSDAERERLVREHFRHYARSFFDRFILWHGSPDRIRRLVRVENGELLDGLAQREPLIVLAPHFLGMDAGGLRLALDHRMATMYANQSNPVLNEAMRRGRMRFNDPVLLTRQDGIRGAVRLLRERVPFMLLPDMDLGPRDAVFVPFFGVPAATVTVLPRLAKMTGARVLPAVTRMTRDGYVVTLHPPWAGYPGEDTEAATRQMNAFIEARVREMPAQYLWTHKRFKTRPPGVPPVYRRD